MAFLSRITCVNTLPFTPLGHQLETAWRVIYSMGGRALLADEVGLGKTIEAGLVLKELFTSGEAKKIIVLSPANLCNQWAGEIRMKFGLPCWVNKKEYGWSYHPCIVASIDLAKRGAHAEIIQSIEYDIIVIDEAHRLKNPNSTNYKFVKSLKTKNLLLLTATPLQNDLKELYYLVDLLRPGYLGSFNDFSSRYMADKRVPKNVEELQNKLSYVMIRNTKRQCSVKLPERVVHLMPLTLSQPEQVLYHSVVHYLKDEYVRRKKLNKSVLGLLTLLREICSSSFAALNTIVSMGLDELIPLARQVRFNEKARVVTEFIKNNKEKVIIFTEYVQTMEYIAMHLRAAGISSFTYHGGLGKFTRTLIQRYFQDGPIQVLISTESGGEGINLQFCSQVINYDLPWNPMRLEQRIGRVHRLGQKNTCHIYNLCTRGTIEEHMLKLLQEKITMVSDTVGDIECLLAGHIESKIQEKALDYLMSTIDENSKLSLEQLRDSVQLEEKEIPSPFPEFKPAPTPLFLF